MPRKTLGEFSRFAASELYPSLQGLDQERMIMKKRFLIGKAILGTIMIGPLIGFMFLNAFYDDNHTPIWVYLLLAIPAITGYIFKDFLDRANLEIKVFRERYKKKIITPIVSFLDPRLSYLPEQCIASHLFVESALFQKFPDSYNGEDLIVGLMDKTPFSFSEITALYKETSHGRERDKDKYLPIFKGLFFVADFNKPFINRTLVYPDIAEKKLGANIGHFIQKINRPFGELIRLENVEFEKEYAVFGNDQIEARYILTPDMMEKLVQFKKTIGLPVYVSFTAKRMFIAIECKENLFEPTYMTSVIDKNTIYKYYMIIDLFGSLVDTLNLNTRIWGKE